MMTTKEFLQAFEEFLGRNGRPTSLSPWAVVEQWESLVDRAAEGYRWGLYEFDNYLSIRDLLEKAFRDDRLGCFVQIDLMRERVEKADVRLKAMFMPGVEIGGADEPWWHRGVLSNAGDEYRDDMKRLHDIEVPS
jgi:hypothetical protein